MRDIDKPFLMAVEDVFSIKGRGTVATGRIERGVIKVGEEVEIIGFKDTQKSVVTGVEMFRKLLDQGQAGDNVGCLLRGIDKEAIERGQVLAKPGSITPHTKFFGEVYVLKKEEGGRHTPFFTNYRPQFYIRTTDVTGTVNLPEGVKMVMPGDNITMEIDAHRAGRARGADALRHPRGRQDRRRRHRHQDPGVSGLLCRPSMNADDSRRGQKRAPVTLACSECKARNYKTTKSPDAEREGARDEEVLQAVQPAHAAPGDEVESRWKSLGV